MIGGIKNNAALNFTVLEPPPHNSIKQCQNTRKSTSSDNNAVFHGGIKDSIQDMNEIAKSSH